MHWRGESSRCRRWFSRRLDLNLRLYSQIYLRCKQQPTDNRRNKREGDKSHLRVNRQESHEMPSFHSWFEAQVTTGETFENLSDEDCSAVYQSQERASSATDNAIMTRLKANSNPREAQRLNRLDSPHANAWISARPSCLDGTDTPQDISHRRCPTPRSTRVLYLCPVPSLPANHGFTWGPPLVLQEVRRQNYEAQSLEKPGFQAR